MNLSKNNFIKSLLGLIVVLILSVPTIFLLLKKGFFVIHDDTQVARVFEMGNSLMDGIFPVRWVENLGYGYGYPIFNFYSPLPYYIGGFINNFGIDALMSTKIMFGLGLLIAGVSMFFFTKKFFGVIPAVVSAIIYTYFPYHAVNAYVRGAVGEIFAYAFLPLVFLGYFAIQEDVESKRAKNIYKWILVSSVGIFLITISHNLSAFMLGIFLTVFILFSTTFSKYKKRLFVIFMIPLLVSFLLSSFYILPAIFEMKYTNIISQIGGGFSYADHFVCLGQLWDSMWGYAGSGPGCIDGMSFKLGKINILLGLFSIGLFVYFKIKNKVKSEEAMIFSSSVLLLLISIFFTLGVSLFIWNFIPFMEFLQFPWRFLNFIGLFLSFIIGYLIFKIGKTLGMKFGLTISVLIILMTLGLNVKLFTPQEILPRDSDFYTNTEYLRWNTSRISDEYMPKEFRISHFAKASRGKQNLELKILRKKFEIVDGKGTIVSSSSKTGKHRVEILLDTKSTIRANIAYFPAWEMQVNGKASDYKIKNDGLYVNLPEGNYDIEFRFIQTPIERTSNIISLIGLIIIVAGIIWRTKLFKI